jgi:hypothetical protein
MRGQASPDHPRHPLIHQPAARAALVLSTWFALVAVFTGAWHDVPLIDDWTYAWTVEHLLQTGRFDVLDWSSAYPVIQAIWGGVWSALFGFSFASLRLSTLVLGVAGCGALYLILRELGASQRMALLGALTLAVNPVFVFLSSSFMTDVPFTTFTTLALLCYVRASTRGDPRLLWWAGAWAYAAFLVRQVGIAVPVAGLPLLLMQAHHPRLTRTRVIVALGATWAVIGATLLVLKATIGTTSIMEKWSWNLYARPTSYLDMNLPLLALLCFYLLPLLLALAVERRVWRRPLVLGSVGIGTAALFVLLLGEIPAPLVYDNTWSTREVGASRLLINGQTSHDAGWFDNGGRLIGWLATSLLALFAITAIGRVTRAWLVNRVDVRRKAIAWMTTRAPLIAFLLAYIAMMNLLWMYTDRYSLPIVPVLVALLLGTKHRPTPAPRVAIATLVVFAAVALLGTRDAIRYNQAVRDVWQSLIDAGIPASDIDAGYAWNGWTLYAHPTNLAPGLTPLKDVPWVTSDRVTEYAVSKEPIEGYTIQREVEWGGLAWPGQTRLLVLSRAAPANAGAADLSTQ